KLLIPLYWNGFNLYFQNNQFFPFTGWTKILLGCCFWPKIRKPPKISGHNSEPTKLKRFMKLGSLTPLPTRKVLSICPYGQISMTGPDKPFVLNTENPPKLSGDSSKP